jgi:hypothetical protein
MNFAMLIFFFQMPELLNFQSGRALGNTSSGRSGIERPRQLSNRFEVRGIM